MTTFKRFLRVAAVVSATGSAALFAGQARADINCTFGTLGSCSGTVGALTFSNFAITSGPLQANDTINISYDNNIGEYVVFANYNPGGNLNGTGTYTFQISAAPGFSFATAAANIDSSASGNTLAFSLTGNPTTLISTGSPTASAAFTTSPLVTSTSVTASFSALSIRSSSLTLTTTPLFAEVPGPLPILGAGAMFGYSRKLRQRVKQTNAG